MFDYKFDNKNYTLSKKPFFICRYISVVRNAGASCAFCRQARRTSISVIPFGIFPFAFFNQQIGFRRRRIMFGKCQ